MVDDASQWALRSVLISVTDLERSTSFYKDVMSIQELQRGDQLALLGSAVTGSLMVILRQAPRTSVHTGQQSLGVRTFSCSVPTRAELDRVEERLRALDAFRDRQKIGDSPDFEILRAYDPDRLPLTFVTFDPGNPISTDEYLRAMSEMYGVDI